MMHVGASFKLLSAPRDGIPSLHHPIANDHVGGKQKGLEMTKKSCIGLKSITWAGVLPSLLSTKNSSSAARLAQRKQRVLEVLTGPAIRRSVSRFN